MTKIVLKKGATVNFTASSRQGNQDHQGVLQQDIHEGDAAHRVDVKVADRVFRPWSSRVNAA